LPETLTKIEAEAFAKCTALTVIEVSPVLKIIEERAFWGCLSLQEISLPASLKTVGKEVFKDCLNLQTVIFANSRLALKRGVFNGCDALETVVLPDGTFIFGYRSLRWGIPAQTHLVTHKELAAAEELMQKALETPDDAPEEEAATSPAEEIAPTEENTETEE
jgi:hypothetical protein